MALKDHDKHFEGIQQAPTPAEDQVPNTVSRHVKVGERAWHTVVAESGKPVLDSELNLHQDASWMENFLLRRWQVPSGWLRGRTHNDVYCDYGLGQDHNVTDDSGSTADDGSLGGSQGGSQGAGGLFLHDDGTLLNSFVLPKLEAIVAGHPVVVEYTNTSTPGGNLIGLNDPTIYDGTNATVKRCDFVFLEVWRALVAPSPRASGQVQVVDSAQMANGDQLLVNGVALTAAAAPGVDQFVLVSGNNVTTAANIAAAINDVANSFDTMVEARANGDTVTILALTPGTGSAIDVPPTGNFITLSVNQAGGGALGSWVASGPVLTGGANRPNKPSTSQGQIYRHGNVQSPSGVWLTDELVDPAIDVESSQRVQIQYRIRTTAASEAVNYKDHPDGFSTLIAGGGPDDAAIFAQGGRNIPVHASNGIDARSYPFVRADSTQTWLQSSAVAYGLTDDGLWVAGDGSEAAAQDLSSIDGFVFAIPICFVHRHNNVSDSLAGFKGFDPENNANGAPMYDHAGYNGPLGVIPAGVSDRPDNHFADVVTQENLLDLRRHVIFPGVDLAAELQYQMQSLLDGSLRTWSVDTASKQTLGGSSGDVSTRMLVCNEIGRSNAAQGNPPLSGDTPRGDHIRNFDHVARRFADQPVVERLVLSFYPGDRPDGVTQGGPVAPGTANPGKYVTKMETVPPTVSDPSGWFEGDTLVFDLENWVVTTLGKVFQGTDGDGDSMGHVANTFLSFAPPGTVFTDVLGMWHDDGDYDSAVTQDVQATIIRGLGTSKVEVTLDGNITQVNGGQPVATHNMVGSDDGADPPAVPNFVANPELKGSGRRIFVEFEVTYPPGVGLTDTPDHLVVPDPAMYNGTGALQVAGTPDGGAVIENAAPQRPADFELLLRPRFRGGFREVQLEYAANDTFEHANPLSGAIGSNAGQEEEIVSRDNRTLFFPRRLYSNAAGVQAGLTRVFDVPDGMVAKTIDPTLTDFGSSSRLVTLSPPNLSGGGQTLCRVEYYAQDPLPNYGALGGGYQVNVYFRTNSPQTAGVKEGDILTTGDGVVPTTLNIEPLLMSKDVWTGQVGMGGHDLAYPYGSPLDQIPVNDGNPLDPTYQTIHEWYFAASAEVSIDDFNANTGLLALHAFVQADIQSVYTFGGTANNQPPRKDGEFRAYYPYADASTYRPTILSQPLFGSTRHKVMVPFLARAIEEVPGVSGGVLFRKSELLLIVLTRFAEMDDENNVRFVDTDNRCSAALYRTRNLLLLVGDEATCHGT